MKQLSLLSQALLTTLNNSSEALETKALYNEVAKTLDVCHEERVKREQVGQAKVEHNIFNRKVRWHQQTLKKLGLIERISRGHWQLTKDGKQTLTRINIDKHMVVASTDLGVIIWGDSTNVFNSVIEEDVHLCIMSPPYLGIERSYGTYNDLEEYIGFILSILTPIRKRMLPGANLAINISNDSVLKQKFGARSHYLEHLILRIASELDLVLMDRLVWHAADKAPKSYQVTRARTHLTSRYEPVLWFCTEPSKTFADNRRVLQPYNAQMKRLIEQGGDKRVVKDSDYQSTSRRGGFGTDPWRKHTRQCSHIPYLLSL